MSFETYHKENAYGEVLYNTSREFFSPLQGEEKYCTAGFKEIGLMYGATEESYRKTSALLNRIRHQEEGGTPSRTIRETTEREGLMIQDHLEQKVCTIFQEGGFTPEGQPPASMLDTLAPQTPLVADATVNEVRPPKVLPEPCQVDIFTDPFADADGQDAAETSGEGVVLQALNELVASRGLSARIADDGGHARTREGCLRARAHAREGHLSDTYRQLHGPEFRRHYRHRRKPDQLEGSGSGQRR